MMLPGIDFFSFFDIEREYSSFLYLLPISFDSISFLIIFFFLNEKSFRE